MNERSPLDITELESRRRGDAETADPRGEAEDNPTGSGRVLGEAMMDRTASDTAMFRNSKTIGMRS